VAHQVHDVVSGAAYGAMLAASLVLARRWRDDPDWRLWAARFRFSRWPAPWPRWSSRPDCRAVQRRGAADRGHASAGRRDSYRRADAHPAGDRFRCRARRHTRPSGASQPGGWGNVIASCW